jgi:hypothetical protein
MGLLLNERERILAATHVPAGCYSVIRGARPVVMTRERGCACANACRERSNGNVSLQARRGATARLPCEPWRLIHRIDQYVESAKSHNDVEQHTRVAEHADSKSRIHIAPHPTFTQRVSPERAPASHCTMAPSKSSQHALPRQHAATAATARRWRDRRRALHSAHVVVSTSMTHCPQRGRKLRACRT